MKSLLRSFAIAFSMYSKIPMPQFTWEKEDMKYSIVFFPLIGAVLHAVTYGIRFLGVFFEIGSVPTGLFMMAAIVVITGGIHVDGYMDCSDAFSSYADREKKLEILKDPHIGAFAVIRVMTLAAVYLASVTIIADRKSPVDSSLFFTDGEDFLIIGLGFILSRALSGISVVSFPCAKNEGTLYSFAEGADKKRCLSILVKEALVVSIAMILIGGICGGCAVCAALAVFWYYKVRTGKELGGITGDAAGWFLCLAETAIALTVCVCVLLGY